jgi:hypothetical protein
MGVVRFRAAMRATCVRLRFTLTQTAHDVGHWIGLFALKTLAVRADLCGCRQEHGSLSARGLGL